MMKCPHCGKEFDYEEPEKETADGTVSIEIEGAPSSIRETLEKLMPKEDE